MLSLDFVLQKIQAVGMGSKEFIPPPLVWNLVMVISFTKLALVDRNILVWLDSVSAFLLYNINHLLLKYLGILREHHTNDER